MTRLSTVGTAVPMAENAPGPDHHGTALLASKLTPPDAAHATLSRPRLLSVLTREVQRAPLTLLSGPAGSGKTVLATGWWQAQAAGRPLGWLNLDEYDDEPATFWRYAIEALSAAGVRSSDVPTLVAGEPPPGWLIPRLAADIAACARPVVLVLDNADHITDRSIVAGLDLLVRQAGIRLRLVLCARADPPLPLHRYRLAGALAAIRGDQLNFPPAEAPDLLAGVGGPVAAGRPPGPCPRAPGGGGR